MDHEKPTRLSAGDGHHENLPVRPSDDTVIAPRQQPKNSSSAAAHPLASYTRAQLAQMGEKYARDQQGLTEEADIRAFRLGAIIAGDLDGDDDFTMLKKRYPSVEGLTEEERGVLVDEVERKWRHPTMLYFLVTDMLTLLLRRVEGCDAVCSLCAVLQSMDETVVNGAQIFYKKQFGIDGESSRDTWLVGLLNSAPYLCCAVIGCLSWPSLQAAFTPQGAFEWYAGWKVIGFILVLHPGTALPAGDEGQDFRELDSVFNVPLHKTMRYGMAQFVWFLRHYILRSSAAKPVVPRAGDDAHFEKTAMQNRDHALTGRV